MKGLRTLQLESTGDDLDAKMLEGYLLDIFKEKNLNRSTVAWTNKYGAVYYFELLSGRELTQAEIDLLPEGTYELSNKNGLKYLG